MGGKYREYSSSRRTSNRDYQKIHPFWRGVGFAMMFLIPIISYAATIVLLKENGKHNWFPFPADLIAGQGQFLYRIFPDPMVNIKLMLIIAFIALFFALFTLFSFLISGLFGPSSRKDPYYVPPLKKKFRRRY